MTTAKSPTKIYGQTSLTDLALHQDFKSIFVLASQPHPILSTDLLYHYSLLVDIGKQRLVDTTIFLSMPAHKSTTTIVSLSLFVATTCNQFH